MELVKKLRKLVTQSKDLPLLQYQSIIELFIFPWTWMSDTLLWAIQGEDISLAVLDEGSALSDV